MRLNGPGKYDDLATMVREQAEAAGVAVIIVGGKLGPGFSVQGTPEFIAGLPALRDVMSASIRRQVLE